MKEPELCTGCGVELSWKELAAHKCFICQRHEWEAYERSQEEDA